MPNLFNVPFCYAYPPDERNMCAQISEYLTREIFPNWEVSSPLRDQHHIILRILIAYNYLKEQKFSANDIIYYILRQENHTTNTKELLYFTIGTIDREICLDLKKTI